MFVFELIPENGNAKSYSVKSGTYSMGKGSECQIPLEDKYVSKHHANLIVSNDTSYLQDNGSTNGIWKAGKRVTSKYIALNTGDRLNMGKLELIVKDAHADSKETKATNLKKSKKQIEKETAKEQKKSSQVKESVVAEKNDETQAQTQPEDEKSSQYHHSDEVIQFKRSIHNKLLEYLDLHRRTDISDMSSAQLRQETSKAVKQVIESEEIPVPETDIPMGTLIKEIVSESIGLGPIEEYLDDESVTEIMVNGPNQIYVERKGKIEEAGTRYSSEQALMSVIERIVTPLGRRIDEGAPMVDARLEDGSRVNVIIPPLALNGPVLTIRKFTKEKLKIDDLIDKGTINENMAKFLEIAVKYRKNIMVSGGTGSGKTTTLNILSNFIPSDERIVTIEDSAELQLSQEHVVSLESRTANIEGKGEVAIRDLVKNSLRMRPDRIVIGECRGGEALDMLQAMNTGHDGSLTTGHANTPRDFLSRLEVMVLMSGIELPVRAIREQIASAVDIIIQQSRFSSGQRRITSIVEVDGIEGEKILLQNIFEYKQMGRDKSGALKGKYTGFGYAPSFYTELKDAGVALDHSIFEINEEETQ